MARRRTFSVSVESKQHLLYSKISSSFIGHIKRLPHLVTTTLHQNLFKTRVYYHRTKLGFFINFALVFEYFHYQSERGSKHQPSGHSRHPWCFHVFFLWKRRGDIFMFPTKCIGILGKITKCDSCQKIWCFLLSVLIYKVVVCRPFHSAGHSG